MLVIVNHPTSQHTFTQKGYWLDASGQLVRSFDTAPPGLGAGVVAKLVDGALAFRSNEDLGLIFRPWEGYVPDLQDPAPVPGWLSKRPETRVAVIRGGRGYLILYDKFRTPEAPFPLEVVTLDGQSCATYDPSCSTNGGNPCPGNSVWNVGLDGTLFTVGLTGDPTHCDAEAWPQLFK